MRPSNWCGLTPAGSVGLFGGVQVILDQKALIQYLLKYQFKGEKGSDAFFQGFKDLLVSCVESGEESLTKVFTKTINMAIASRDYGSVETMHLLLGLPLVESSRSTVRLCLAFACIRAPQLGA